MVLAVFVDELAKCGGSSMISAIFLDEKGAVRAWLGDAKPRKKQKM